MKKQLTAAAAVILLTLVGVAAGFALFEYKVRGELRGLYAGNATPMMVFNTSLVPSQIDQFFGRTPKTDPRGVFRVDGTRTTTIIAEQRAAFQSVVRTNNLGFLSDHVYSVERPKGRREFRVAFIGDSMTGTTTMDFQWVDLVEKKLNGTAGLAAAVGADIFKTYNCGVPGAGFPSFWKYYDEYCRNFDPDLVIVNYIESDFPRTGKSGAEAHLSDEDAMTGGAADVVDKFVKDGRRVVFTVMPLFQDLYPKLVDYHLTRAVMARSPGADFAMMHERMIWRGNVGYVRSWYNLPYDGHLSEIGGGLYAEAMARLIAERLTGRKAAPVAAPPPEETSRRLAALSADDLAADRIPGDAFEMLPDAGAPKRIGGSRAVDAGGAWSVIADGTDGAGIVEISRIAIPESERAAPLSDRFGLRLAEVKVPTAGQSSVSLTAFRGWRQLGGHAFDLVFRARAVGAAEKVMGTYVVAGFGPQVNRAPLYPVNTVVALSDTWSEHRFSVDVPIVDPDNFGPPDSESIVVRFSSVPTGTPTGFEVTDIHLLPARSAGGADAGGVRIGDRVVSVAPFLKLRDEINRRYLAARNRSLRLYGLNRLLGKEAPYGTLPPGVTYYSGFEKLTLPATPPEPVYLNVFCLSEPITIDNPDCYHSYQFFAR